MSKNVFLDQNSGNLHNPSIIQDKHKNEVLNFTTINKQVNNIVKPFNNESVLGEIAWLQLKENYSINHFLPKDRLVNPNDASHNSAVEINNKAGEDISNYRISPDGLVHEHWDNTTYIPSRILQVDENEIILECLVDIDNRIIENRSFKKSFFEGVLQFELYAPILIAIFERAGELRITVKKGFSSVYHDYFEQNYFQQGTSDIFSKKF